MISTCCHTSCPCCSVCNFYTPLDTGGFAQGFTIWNSWPPQGGVFNRRWFLLAGGLPVCAISKKQRWMSTDNTQGASVLWLGLSIGGRHLRLKHAVACRSTWIWTLTLTPYPAFTESFWSGGAEGLFVGSASSPVPVSGCLAPSFECHAA